MQNRDTPVCAAIDIGSNTLRVVIARCEASSITILATDEAMVRIGESVNEHGRISDEKQDLTISVLRQFQSLAKEHSAEVTLAIATEAIRKAANKDAFVKAIQEATGITVQCIGGDVEAVLTFYGATYALTREAHPPTSVGVMDLGGGSTELILARNMHISWHTSLPIGSGWLYDRYLTADPATSADKSTAYAFLHTFLRGLNVKHVPPVLYATGGSANTLLLLAQRAFGLDASATVLTRDDLIRCEGLLWALSAGEIAQRYQIDEKRAHLISAGVLILLAVVDRFSLKELHISTYGIREGLALAYARYGDEWLARVQAEAQRSEEAAQQIAHDEPVNAYTEPFILAGARMLRERAQVMLSWRDAVLLNEDVEAVHKMRVATRRLRAVMDAYQGIAVSKAFKPVYRLVKQTADILGVARDTDVMIENLRGRLEHVSIEEQAGIRLLLQRLERYRAHHQHTLETHIKQLDKAKFMRQIEECLPKEG